MIFVFIIYFPFIVLAFFDLSSLRTHFWPLPFPSENFGGRGKKVTGDRGPRLSPKLKRDRRRGCHGFRGKTWVLRGHACLHKRNSAHAADARSFVLK